MGGLIGVFNQGSQEKTRTVFIPYLASDRIYQVRQGYKGNIVMSFTIFSIIKLSYFESEYFKRIIVNTTRLYYEKLNKTSFFHVVNRRYYAVGCATA